MTLYAAYSHAIVNYSFLGQSVAMMVLFSLMVQVLQDLAGLKCVPMAYGEPSVMPSGTTEMQVLYADSLDSHHMVIVHMQQP